MSIIYKPAAAGRSPLLRWIFQQEVVRYGLASVFALATDMGVFSALMRLADAGHAPAATAGFIAGAAIAYVISVTWVFAERSFKQHPAMELLTFLVIGLGGLALTQSVLWVGIDRFHMLPEGVKLIAAGATFVFNFFLRKLMLFRANSELAGAFLHTR